MKKLILISAVVLMAVSCGTLSMGTSTANTSNGTSVSTQVTAKSGNFRESLYPLMYEEKPITLLVMPPINNSTNVDAKEYLYTTISKPLVDAGYYVISPLMAMEILKAESAYDAELFRNSSLAPFLQFFGADAVVFSEISKWVKVGIGIETDIKYTIISTRTGNTLFERNCELFLKLTTGVSNPSGWLELLVNAAATLANTAMTDHIEAAKKVNYYVFRDIPRGKYSSDYLLDQGTKTDAQNLTVTIE